jgi:outer membrane protein TolC
LSGTLKAQDSLSVYLDLAGKNNPGLQAKYLEYSAALEKVPQASSLPDPTAQLGFYLKPMELLGGNQISNIQVMQMFPWFGTLKAAKDEASQMAVMKFEEARDARNMLFSEVKASWYRIYRDQKEISILNENLELLRTLEKISISSYSSGKITGSTGSSSGAMSAPAASASNSGGMSGMNSSPTSQQSPASGGMNGGGSGSMKSKGSGMVDVLRVQMEIAELENRISNTQDLLSTEIARFNSYLDRAPETPVSVPDSLEVAGLKVDLNALSDSLRNNPMLKMSLAEKSAGMAQQQMATKMAKPMLGVGANYMLIEKRPGNTLMMNGNDMVMPMVSVTLPIFSKKYKAMKREAGFKIETSEKSYENTQNMLEVSFLEQVRMLKDADRRLDLYRKQAALAEISVKLLTTAYSVSDADINEVLRMQEQLLNYNLQELNALTDRNTAAAQLEYLAGLEN